MDLVILWVKKIGAKARRWGEKISERDEWVLKFYGIVNRPSWHLQIIKEKEFLRQQLL